MKKIYLIRHAKSSWAFDLHDHDRPLGKRGRRDVVKMGKYLAKHQEKPDILISSTASRAFYTALHLCDQMGIDEGKIRLTKALFHVGPVEILSVIHKAPDCGVLAIFGHNPGFTSMANALAGLNIDNIPTCGVVGMSFDVRKWSEIDFGMGKKDFFYYPKALG